MNNSEEIKKLKTKEFIKKLNEAKFENVEHQKRGGMPYAPSHGGPYLEIFDEDIVISEKIFKKAVQ